MPCPMRNTQVKEDDSIAQSKEEQTAMLAAVSVWEGIQEDNLQRFGSLWISRKQTLSLSKSEFSPGFNSLLPKLTWSLQNWS